MCDGKILTKDKYYKIVHNGSQKWTGAQKKLILSFICQEIQNVSYLFNE